MAKEDRFYAFIIAHTSRSRARVQRVRIERKVVSISCVVALFAGVALVYGFYGLTQQATHLRTSLENQQLRAENDRQRQELAKLNNRVERVEDTSRKLAEKSGVVEGATILPGTGGPELPLDEMALATLASKMSRLEEDMRAYEQVLRERGYTLQFGQSMGNLKVALVGVVIRLAALGGSSTPDRTLRHPWEPRWLLEPVVASRLLVGKMVMGS